MTSPLIAITAADKGGVGKTTVTRTFLDYCAKIPVATRKFDTEPGEEGVLRRFYPDAEQLLVDSVRGQVKMIDDADGASITVVDARAGLLTPIMAAFERMKMLEDVRAGVMRLLVFHVIGPNVASKGEIENVVKGLHGAKLIQVLNYMNPDAQFNMPNLSHPMKMPYLDEAVNQLVDESNQPFSIFRTDPKHKSVYRRYVAAWQDEVFAEYDRVGVGALLRE